MYDYIVVGAGLAGIAFVETALSNNKKVLVFDNNSQNSTKIAAGLYNPVVLKRFSEVDNAQNQLTYLTEFYKQIEKRCTIQLDFKLPILRKFFSAEEQNNWFAAADKVNLAPFLSLTIAKQTFPFIDSPFGFGVVLQTGYVATGTLLETYHDYLTSHQMLRTEAFDYDAIIHLENAIDYKNIQTKHIVFAEGFGLHANPFFNYLPLDGTKGELLIIKAPNLQLDVILNSSVFILPLGNDYYKVGATYNWKDKTCLPTPQGRKEIEERLRELVSCEFEIISHQAGVRPTVRDRKPLVGTHSKYKRLHVLNGLGTRGVMIGPTVAKNLFDSIENQVPLSATISIKRFEK